jgi:DNA-binding CsgD family transcriptional regulator
MNSNELVRDTFAFWLGHVQGPGPCALVNAMVVARIPERARIITQLSGGRPSVAHRERAQTPRILVMLVDPYPLVRSGLRRILENEPDIVVVEVDEPYDRLTNREKQVLQLIAQGQSNRQIARMLRVSVNTVAVHRANLMNTLGVHKATGLVLFAVKRGLVVTE